MSNKVYYNKLIRDKIPDKIAAKGEKCEVRSISDNQEYEQELLKKIAEEASGLSRSNSRDDFLAEYTDLKVVLDELLALQGFSSIDVQNALKDSIEKKGGFNDRYFLHWSDDSGYKSNETPQGLNNT